MYPRITRLICLLLMIATLAGICSGCHNHQTQIADNTGLANWEQFSSTAPPPTDTSALTQQIVTPPAIFTQVFEPQPLNPSASATVQPSVSQKPCRPDIALPKVNAANYFVYDTRLDDFLYVNCNTDKTLYPASITKLFTTYVALQYLKPEDVVTVGAELSYVAGDASAAGFKKGDRVSVEVLVHGALLPSGCDASYILAATAGKIILGDKNASAKSAINAFMTECNRLAKELGMTKTNFVTPDGYHDPDHKVSVQAFVIIGKCSLENSLIRQVAAKPSATISYTNSSGQTVQKKLTNTNKTIRSDGSYYNSLSVGLKTGFTDAAGYCLLTAYEVDGRYIIIGIFGSSNTNDRFNAANNLFDAYLPYI